MLKKAFMVNGCRCMINRRLDEDWANCRRGHVGGEPWAKTGRGVRSAAGGASRPVFARGSSSTSTEAARGGDEGVRVGSAIAAEAGWAWRHWRA
ncbi:hypothetical protein GUJ93_ZPchr0007g3801 [Zizania palustris]|uniref:Uncharacterized protein n=1 Tax=Zizania palustris TaxID=103762 RepID=A0A8J5T7B8_ZIZPA|nr:hypothetical protein GUJ93_ZPchr0007g3801 [Zizania palustris]